MQKKIKFFIIGLGRSGSNLLVSLMRSHPEIYCDYEILNQDYLNQKPLSKRQLIQWFPGYFLQYRSARSPRPVYGFKMLYYQYLEREKQLKSLFDSDWKIIHIKRKDVFKQAVSDMVARKTGVYLQTDKRKQPDDIIRIDPGSFRKYIEKILHDGALLENALKNIDHCSVVYEEDLIEPEMWDNSCARVFRYIGVQPAPVSTITERISKRPYESVVENYESLVSEVKNSPYAYLLNQPY